MQQRAELLPLGRRARAATATGAARSEATTPPTIAGADARALRETAAVNDDGSSIGWWVAVVAAVVGIAGASFVAMRRRAGAR